MAATKPDETPTPATPYPPVHAIGQVERKDGTHVGWIMATQEAVLGTVQYVSDRQVMVTLTHGKVTHLGALADLERGALIALCPLARDEA